MEREINRITVGTRRQGAKESAGAPGYPWANIVMLLDKTSIMIHQVVSGASLLGGPNPKLAVP